MAVDMFLKIDGVKGESKDSKHKGEIDILAWSWGMSNSGSTHVGGGGGSGKVNVQDLSFTKYLDKATPTLMLFSCNGKHINEATLVVRKAGETPVEYLTIKMSEIIVTSVSTGGSGGEDRLTENITFNFAKVAVDYVPQSDKGAPEAKIPMTWDIAANKK